jgi:uncharacterized SAM-binding protein YcdF (DUF218 family)
VAEARGGLLVAVLGYSPWRDEGLALHPICVGRLRHAERLAEGARAVLLSGWSRHPHGTAEAELMRALWEGPDVPLVCDPTASHTSANAVGVARLARRLGVDEVVVVTSRWHGPRAHALVWAALRGSGVRVRTDSPDEPAAAVRIAGELVSLLTLPVQLYRLRTNGS